MLTKCSFISCAVASSSKDSRSMTWHQWHALYPIESRTGLSSVRARSNASSPHGYQSTGFPACWRRYGLVSCTRRFISRPHELGVSAEPDRLVERTSGLGEAVDHRFAATLVVKAPERV